MGALRDGDGRAGDTTLVPSDRVVECATLRVPLDYREPYQTISIALNRIKGTASRDRDHLGALLVNPGGRAPPGCSWPSTSRRSSPPGWPSAST
nr:hypothetical protein GCM10020093_101230 [Planobispora longispora]